MSELLHRLLKGLESDSSQSRIAESLANDEMSGSLAQLKRVAGKVVSLLKIPSGAESRDVFSTSTSTIEFVP